MRGALCGKSARRVLRGGLTVRAVPTANAAQQKEADRESKAQTRFWTNIGKSVVIPIARDMLRLFLKKR